MKKLLILAALFLAAPFVSSAQEEEEDASKMIREVINVEMEKPKAAATATPPPVEDHKGKKGKKKHVEEPPPVAEEVLDSGVVAMMPATITELSKRATYWYTTKNKKFEKSSGGGSGSQTVCNVKFNYKPKELNPANDVEGEITMRVTIDCKEGKYRYTIDKIEHKAKRGTCSGGDVFNEVPACGSMNLNSVIWKQIKSAGLSNAKLVAEDLKAKMAKPVPTTTKGDW